MKKLFTMLVLLATTIGAMAQLNGTWTNPHTNQAGEFTTVYASLQVKNAANYVYQGNYTLAAFVGYFGEEECRLVTLDNAQGVLQKYLKTQTQSQTQFTIAFLTLQVPGNYDDVDDTNKPITFMLKDNASGLIYLLETSEYLTFRENSWGTPSDPVALTVTLPESYELNSFDVDKGGWVYLPDQVSVTPSTASKPRNAWQIVDGYTEYAHISNDTIYGDKPIKGAEITMENFDTGENMAETTFNVIQHATNINIVTQSYTVIKGLPTLTWFMNNKLTSSSGSIKAYSLTPEDANDEVLWEVDPEYIEYDPLKTNNTWGSITWEPIKRGTTYIRPYIQIGQQKIYPENPSQIEINIVVSVANAYLDWDADVVNIVCNVGDDIYQRIQNRFVAEPEDAAQTFKVELTDKSDSQYLTIGTNSVKAIKPTTEELLVWIVPTGTYGSNKKFQVKVTIKNNATSVGYVKSTVNLGTTMTQDEMADAILENVTYAPEGSLPYIQLTGSGNQWCSGSIVGSEDDGSIDRTFVFNGTFVEGTYQVVATLTYPDYSNFYGLTSQITYPEKSTTFTVVLSTGLERFDIDWLPYGAPYYGVFRMTPVPENAEYNLSDYTINLFSPDEYTEIGWNPIDDFERRGLDTYVDVTLPGLYTFTVRRTSDNADFGSAEVDLPAHIEHNFGGWKWSTIPYGQLSGNKISSFFNSKVVEARTYSDVLINDPEWGFMGSLLTSGIGKAQMYKANVGQYSNDFYYYQEGDIGLDSEHAWTLQPGWNWIGSPYYYDRLFSNVIEPQEDVVQGMVIVSKADGQKEYDGTAWQGNLNVLKAKEGYLVYNPTNAVKYISLPSEGHMSQGDEKPAGARSSRQSVWSYDHSRFANNMVMVAEMPELPYAEQYTIGAFVGDECRGEGEFIDGMAFITVHCKNGEQVSFRLHNEATGEYYDIDQTVKSRQRIGSLQQPLLFTSEQIQQVVTGISDVKTGATRAQCYDLGGRRTVNSKVSIVRMANGTYRKVVK